MRPNRAISWLHYTFLAMVCQIETRFCYALPIFAKFGKFSEKRKPRQSLDAAFCSQVILCYALYNRYNRSATFGAVFGMLSISPSAKASAGM